MISILSQMTVDTIVNIGICKTCFFIKTQKHLNKEIKSPPDVLGRLNLYYSLI